MTSSTYYNKYNKKEETVNEHKFLFSIYECGKTFDNRQTNEHEQNHILPGTYP